MTVRNLTTDEFLATVQRPGVVLVDFWASWCGPCRTFAPIFEAAAERHPSATFAKVDTQAEPTLAAALEIRAIPTLMVFRDGFLVYRESGALPPAALDLLVRKVCELDMDAARREREETGA